MTFILRALTKPADLFLLRKTDLLQTNFLSAESVFSLCRHLCLHHLQRCFPADEKQMKNRSAHAGDLLSHQSLQAVFSARVHQFQTTKTLRSGPSAGLSINSNIGYIQFIIRKRREITILSFYFIHLWTDLCSYQSTFMNAAGKSVPLRVRFFTKIRDRIKNPDH